MSALQDNVADGGDSFASTIPGSPFKFLDYYTSSAGDRAAFAGREREIREISGLVLADRTLVLYGRSGLGKTSLLLAGVLPTFPLEKYLTVYVRTLESPLADLRAAVAEQANDEYSFETSLTEVVRLAAKGRSTLLVFDQFEEFFVRFRDQPKAREEFAREVASLVADRSLEIRAIFSLREDYLAEMDDFRRELPDVFNNQYRLQPLTAFGARRAIANALEHANVTYDQALLIRLVDTLADFGFDPAILQIVCTEVYRAATSAADNVSPHLTVKDLDSIGGIEGIFRKYIDAATAAIEKTDQLLARNILDALITQERTKRAVTVDDLLTRDFVADPEKVHRIITELHQQRIVRRENRRGVYWYELLHERLVEHIQRWLDIDGVFRRFRSARDLIANSARGEEWRNAPDLLLTKGQLTEVIEEFRDHLSLQRTQLEHVLRSALYSSSESVLFWADRFGLGHSQKLLLQLLRSEHAGLRCRAAAAARTVTGPEAGELARLCLRLSMNDAEADVRRAAGRSLAHIATEDELDELREALRHKATAKNARAVLADFVAEGREAPGVGRLNRWRARREAVRRTLRENIAAIQDARSSGLWWGFVASLIWISTIGLVLDAFETLSSEPTADAVGFWTKFAWVAVSVALVIITFSLVVGRAVAGSVVRQRLLAPQKHWGRAVVRLPYVWVCFWMIGLIPLTYMFAFWLDLRDEGAGGLSLLVYLLASTATCALLVFGMACFARLVEASANYAWWWILAASAGWPLLIPLLLQQAARLGATNEEQPGNTSVSFHLILMTSACLFSSLSFVSTMSIARTTCGSSDGRVRPFDRHLWSRLALSAGTLGVFVYMLIACDVHILPDVFFR